MNEVRVSEVQDLLQLAIREDRGGGDVTSEALIPPEARARAVYRPKHQLVVAGLGVAQEVARLCDPDLRFRSLVSDGDSVESGTVLAELEGSSRSILLVERTSLNFLQRLSGIASETRRYVDAVVGTRAVIVDTRKTVPGHRLLDKYAVRCGGGLNHRIGLFDAILIKNNHIEFQEDARSAVRKARQHADPALGLEIEVRDLDELMAALDGDPDVILLDNFTPDDTRRAVDRVDHKVALESSGGITLANVRQYAEAGVDRISVGALTHSVIASDINLRVSPLP
jgi:nicotinate-nucleotide pyrophosphorylase (carboxylating)